MRELTAAEAARNRSTPNTPPKVQLAAASTLPPQAAEGAASETEVVALVESLIATYQAAVEAGCSAFDPMRSIEQVVAALGGGVRGSGQFADTVFRVPGLSENLQNSVCQRLAVFAGKLVMVTPDKSTMAPAADPRRVFADGQLKVLIPEGFEAESAGDDDLLLRRGGVTLRIHLEKQHAGLDAWAAVKFVADRQGGGVKMSGTKIYLTTGGDAQTQTVTIGFDESLVSIQIEAEAAAPGRDQTRFALPGIIASLDAAG